MLSIKVMASNGHIDKFDEKVGEVSLFRLGFSNRLLDGENVLRVG